MGLDTVVAMGILQESVFRTNFKVRKWYTVMYSNNTTDKYPAACVISLQNWSHHCAICSTAQMWGNAQKCFNNHILDMFQSHKDCFQNVYCNWHGHQLYLPCSFIVRYHSCLGCLLIMCWAQFSDMFNFYLVPKLYRNKINNCLQLIKLVSLLLDVHKVAIFMRL